MTKNLDEFKKLAKDPVGTIYVDKFEDGVRVLIMRGPASLCAYLGIPESHPLAGFDYNDLPVRCHGGLTFSSSSRPKSESLWPKGYYWYGWDYAHCDDLCFYSIDDPRWPSYSRDPKAWTVKDVESEIWSVVYDFKKVMKIVEDSFTKGMGWRGNNG
jgi:hypothetical protein